MESSKKNFFNMSKKTKITIISLVSAIVIVTIVWAIVDVSKSKKANSNPVLSNNQIKKESSSQTMMQSISAPTVSQQTNQPAPQVGPKVLDSLSAKPSTNQNSTPTQIQAAVSKSVLNSLIAK